MQLLAKALVSEVASLKPLRLLLDAAKIAYVEQATLVPVYDEIQAKTYETHVLLFVSSDDIEVAIALSTK